MKLLFQLTAQSTFNDIVNIIFFKKRVLKGICIAIFNAIISK